MTSTSTQISAAASAHGVDAGQSKPVRDGRPVEFWDAGAQRLPRTRRAMLVFLGALSICVMLITSAAAFATLYIL